MVDVRSVSLVLGAGDGSNEMQRAPLADFYRAMLSIRGINHGPVSVCLSVRHKSVFHRNG